MNSKKSLRRKVQERELEREQLKNVTLRFFSLKMLTDSFSIGAKVHIHKIIYLLLYASLEFRNFVDLLKSYILNADKHNCRLIKSLGLMSTLTVQPYFIIIDIWKRLDDKFIDSLNILGWIIPGSHNQITHRIISKILSVFLQ